MTESPSRTRSIRSWETNPADVKQVEMIRRAHRPAVQAVPGQALPVPENYFPGVYFLSSASHVVYVGQSIEIRTRVASHKRAKSDREIHFDSAHYISYPADELDYWETVWILRLMPLRNFRSHRCPVELVTELGLIGCKNAAEVCALLESVGPECLVDLRGRRSSENPLFPAFPDLGVPSSTQLRSRNGG